MNFIVIMSDSLRPDHLSAYGCPFCRTPHLGRFAETAAAFDKYYVGSFATIPNRTDLFTGRYGEPLHPWLPLSYNEITLPEIMRENGYITQLVCNTPHLVNGGHNFDWPFHTWDFIRGNEVDRYGMDSDPVALPFGDASKVNVRSVNKSVCQYLRNNRGRQKESDWITYRTFQTAAEWLARNRRHEKLFLWIDGFDPHEPDDPPQEYIDMYDPGYDGDMYLAHIPDPSRLTAAELDNVIARYRANVTFVDRCIGMLFEALDRLGMTDNTCVVCLSDHGIHLNEHGGLLNKRCQWAEVARSVHMIRTPDGLSAGQLVTGGALRRCAPPTSAGLQNRPNARRKVRPLTAGARLSAGKHFNDLVQPADLAPTILDLAGIEIPERMQGTSYLPLLKGESFTTRDVAISASAPNALRDSATITARDQRWQLIDQPDPTRRELYDLEADPGQTRNVVSDHPDVAARLHAAIVEFLKTHEAQPQIVRWFETGDKGDMTGYVAVRPGYERFHCYWEHIWDSGTLS